MESFFSEEDCVQLAFLRDEEVDELVAAKFLPEESRLISPLEAPIQFPFPDLILHVKPSAYYPVLSEFNDFFRLENLQLGRVPCDTLRAQLLGIYDQALPTNAISMWDSREELNPYGIFERTMLVFKLVSLTQEFLKKHEESERERLRVYHSHTPSPERNKTELQTKRLSDVKSSSEVARELLGSAEKVVENIPNWMRVLHVEEILRADLTKKFTAKRVQLKEKLEHMSAASLSHFLPGGVTARRKEDAIDKILTPRLTFHGTRRSNVPLIVRHGFLKPGSTLPKDAREKGNGPGVHQVQQGSAYGQGIYSSPSAQFSLDYSGSMCTPVPTEEYFGIKLIVCATLMGKTVYVIHLDWGDRNHLHYYIPADPTQWTRRPATRKDPDTAPTMAGASGMTPGERKRAKEAVMARASKWFPYGFGPKTKGNFVVEDVGYISDDEEDYGDYQALRADEETGGGNRAGNTDYWSWVKAAEAEDEMDKQNRSLDEYTSQRRNYAPGSLDWDSIQLPGESLSVEQSDDDDLGIGGLLFTRRMEES